MENKSTVNKGNKHPQPSENVQMDIETVTPDKEGLTTDKDHIAEEEGKREHQDDKKPKK